MNFGTYIWVLLSLMSNVTLSGEIRSITIFRNIAKVHLKVTNAQERVSKSFKLNNQIWRHVYMKYNFPVKPEI